jgi:hypothetical protein
MFGSPKKSRCGIAAILPILIGLFNYEAKL